MGRPLPPRAGRPFTPGGRPRGGRPHHEAAEELLAILREGPSPSGRAFLEVYAAPRPRRRESSLLSLSRCVRTCAVAVVLRLDVTLSLFDGI